MHFSVNKEKNDKNSPEREAPGRIVKIDPSEQIEQERDFTGGGIFSLPKTRGSTGNKEIDRRIADLVADWNCEGGNNNPLIEEMIITSLRIAKDSIGEADLKLFNRSLKEMRASSHVFNPYRHERKISIFGSARTEPGQPEYEAAEAFAARMREKGFMAITGAGDGIMGAAQAGAGRERGFGLNIRLPFEQGANEVIEGDPKLITYNYFFTRKLAFVKESDACALFPGGFGTMDEGFELLTLMQTGKSAIIPVVMVDAPGGSYWKTWLQFVKEHLLRLRLISEEDLNLFKTTDNIEEAVSEILNFYAVYHSYRFVGDKMVIRLQREIPPELLAWLNEDFGDILSEGEFTLSKALPEEANEDQLKDMQRLVLQAKRGKAGRIRELINRLNSVGAES